MRASESHPQFKSKVREYTNFATRGLTKVCKEIGPRPAGSEAELKAQEYMENEYKTCADETHIEAFETHPDAFLGSLKAAAVLMTAAIVLCVLRLYIIALTPAVLAVIVLFGELLLRGQIIDFLFPKKTSHNLIAVRKASGETKRRLILSGHMDSSPEWTPAYLGGKGLMSFVKIYAALGFVYIAVVGVLGIVLPADSGVLHILGWVSLAFLPAYALLFFFASKKNAAQGANTDLTGVFCAAAVMKYMADHDLRFENTELVCMATGSREAGLRGAKAYVKAHADEIRNGGVETLFISVDTVRDYDAQTVYEKSGGAAMDPRACALLKKAGELSEVELQTASGESDAAAVAKAGIPAAVYSAAGKEAGKLMRTRNDNWENVDRKSVEKGVEILINAAYLFDEQGLEESYR
ncbi:MAG: M28 family peptidase [Clostridia bacterium]|nr:M28 family peptidase [Clostridia bacterium]